MAGPDDPDYIMDISAVEPPAQYDISFGSLIRMGRIYQHPDEAGPSGGRVSSASATVEEGETHRWEADGPLHLLLRSGEVTISINGGSAVPIETGGSLDFSCPTERKRITAIGAVAGAGVGVLSGMVGR